MKKHLQIYWMAYLATILYLLLGASCGEFYLALKLTVLMAVSVFIRSKIIKYVKK